MVYEEVRTNKKLGENIDDEVMSYFLEYSPAGYGTELKKIKYLKDDVVVLCFTRMESCD